MKDKLEQRNQDLTKNKVEVKVVLYSTVVWLAVKVKCQGRIEKVANPSKVEVFHRSTFLNNMRRVYFV